MRRVVAGTVSEEEGVDTREVGATDPVRLAQPTTDVGGAAGDPTGAPDPARWRFAGRLHRLGQDLYTCLVCKPECTKSETEVPAHERWHEWRARAVPEAPRKPARRAAPTPRTTEPGRVPKRAQEAHHTPGSEHELSARLCAARAGRTRQALAQLVPGVSLAKLDRWLRGDVRPGEDAVLSTLLEHAEGGTRNE